MFATYLAVLDTSTGQVWQQVKMSEFLGNYDIILLLLLLLLWWWCLGRASNDICGLLELPKFQIPHQFFKEVGVLGMERVIGDWGGGDV